MTAVDVALIVLAVLGLGACLVLTVWLAAAAAKATSEEWQAEADAGSFEAMEDETT